MSEKGKIVVDTSMSNMREKNVLRDYVQGRFIGLIFYIETQA